MCQLTGQRDSFCGICVKLKSLLKQHIRLAHDYQPKIAVHKMLKIRSFSCINCNETFTKRSKFNRHLLTHQNLSEYFACANIDTQDSCPNIGYPTENAECKPNFSLTNEQNQDGSGDELILECESTSQNIGQDFWEQFKSVNLSQSDCVTTNIENVTNTCHYQCNECDSVFRNSHGLKRHYENDHPNLLMFKCDDCSKLFKTINEYKIHNCDESENENLQIYTCESCKLFYKTKDAFMNRTCCESNREKQMYAKEKGENGFVYRCTKCGHVSKKSGNITNHFKCVHLGIKAHVCRFCMRNFKHKKSLQKHICIRKPKELAEESVNHPEIETRLKSENQELHKEEEQNQEESSLPSDQIFELAAIETLTNISEESTSTKIEVTDTSTPTKFYTCESCKLFYKTKEAFMNHTCCNINREKQMYVKEKGEYGFDVYRCTECGHLSKKSGNIVNHFRCVHLNIKAHVCKFCKRKFKHKKSLQKHICIYKPKELEEESVKHPEIETRLKSENQELHKEEEQNQEESSLPSDQLLELAAIETLTNISEESTKTKIEVTDTSTPTKFYTCESCKLFYKTKEAFMNHTCCNINREKQMYVKEKGEYGFDVYRCTECGHLSKKSGNIVNHFRCVHLNIKAHVCKFCKRKFKHKKSLQKHICLHKPIELEEQGCS